MRQLLHVQDGQVARRVISGLFDVEKEVYIFVCSCMGLLLTSRDNVQYLVRVSPSQPDTSKQEARRQPINPTTRE